MKIRSIMILCTACVLLLAAGRSNPHCNPAKSHHAPAFDFDTLPHADAVVISHNHYDHLDLETVKRLNRQKSGPPRKLADALSKAGVAPERFFVMKHGET